MVNELEKLGEAVLALYRSLAQAAEKPAPDNEMARGVNQTLNTIGSRSIMPL